VRGTKRKRRDGVWEIRAYVGRDPVTGKPRQLPKTVYGSATAAEGALRDLLDRQAPARADGLGVTVGQLIDRRLEECVLARPRFRRCLSLDEAIGYVEGIGRQATQSTIRRRDRSEVATLMTTICQLSPSSLAPIRLCQAIVT